MLQLDSYLQSHHKSHLIFDFDETLFWLVLPWKKYDQEIKKQFSTLDAQVTEAYLKGDISLSQMNNTLVEKYGDSVLAKLRDISLAFETLLTNVVPNTDLVEYLRTQGSRYHMSIWSTNTSRIIGKVLKDHHLEALFSGIASRLELTYVKPNPEGYTRLAIPGVPQDKYVMIGNSVADKSAAMAAGIDYFHIDYFTKKEQAD